MKKAKVQGSGKKRNSQTRRKVSVLMDNNLYEDKENARRKLCTNNLSKFLTSPCQILSESKES